MPITKLEQDIHGNPKEFNKVLEAMVNGGEGELRISNARRLLPKLNIQPATYYFAQLEGSDYSFAYSLADTDRVNEPLFAVSSHNRFQGLINYFFIIFQELSRDIRAGRLVQVQKILLQFAD